MHAYERIKESLDGFKHTIPCISAGAAGDSLAAFPSLLALDSYDTQAKICLSFSSVVVI